MNREDMHCDVV
ncbi:hypothetical protein MUA02_00300 [Enterobacteriaceae bacterium H20N1]|uniref:Uncharacterized protein n=1 Tax=Dryocola boscaweniae TaxID=2925397 RepID=A0A9X2W3B6_9ENTR|nr:hypothetical protein [Dryocola boscaweniae]MCT4716803.1 hypothetical protein [Dryocola boscaweniae]MCT4717520.1 hypothetical protein [Dryocola boscaweniae]